MEVPAAEVAVPAEDAQASSEASPDPERQILGLHPQALCGVVFAPLVVFAACAVAAGPAKEHIKEAVTMGLTYWNTVSDPIEKILVERGDLLVVLAAMTTFAPFALLAIVTFSRALFDLRNFTTWQKVIFFALTFCSLATIFVTTEGTLWTIAKARSIWDEISDPLEKVIADNSDYFVAGAAMVALGPIAICVVITVLRAIWNCRVRITVEPEVRARS